MTATISTFDNTTKRASNAAQTNSQGTNRAASESFEYEPGESAANACERLQRENFNVLERVLAAR